MGRSLLEKTNEENDAWCRGVHNCLRTRQFSTKTQCQVSKMPRRVSNAILHYLNQVLALTAQYSSLESNYLSSLTQVLVLLLDILVNWLIYTLELQSKLLVFENMAHSILWYKWPKRYQQAPIYQFQLNQVLVCYKIN